LWCACRVLRQQFEQVFEALQDFGVNGLPVDRGIVFHVLLKTLLEGVFGCVKLVNIVLFPDSLQNGESQGAFDKHWSEKLSFFHVENLLNGWKVLDRIIVRDWAS
jgi:hypothetical protein